MNQVINWANYCFRSTLLGITYIFDWLKGFYKRHYNLSTIGILGTLGYFSFLYQTLGIEPIIWMKGAENFNEVGDFLAGVFGPIAFFWLIIGYQMQHSELRLNRVSLEKQADELKYSRKALELQVSEFKNSVDIQRKTLEFNELQNLKREEQIKRNAKPLIRFDKVFYTEHHDISRTPDPEEWNTLEFNIRNLAAEITNLELTISTDTNNSFSTKYLDILTRNDSIRIYVHPKEYAKDFKLYLKYINSLGEHHGKNYILSIQNEPELIEDSDNQYYHANSFSVNVHLVEDSDI